MLNRNNFDIAELAPNDEDSPPILCGIQVSPGGTSVTDGHMAVMVTAAEQIQTSLFAEAEGVTPADHFTPFVLDRESALRVAKSIPKKKEESEAVYPVIDATTEGRERAMISINDVYRQEIIRSRKIEGTFPDICKVLPPQASAKFTITMSPELLLSVLKAVTKFCNGRDVNSCTLTLYGKEKPLRIDVDGNGQALTAVVMPLRSDATE